MALIFHRELLKEKAKAKPKESESPVAEDQHIEKRKLTKRLIMSMIATILVILLFMIKNEKYPEIKLTIQNQRAPR